MSPASQPTDGSSATGETPHRRLRVLDLLAEAIVDAPGLTRSGHHFSCAAPWTVAHYGRVVLRRGWWVFECEGEGAADDVELRLRSPEDGLLVLSRRRDPSGKVYFHADRTFDVSVLLSAWPGEMTLRILRLRRLGKLEVAQLVAAMMSRLVRSGKPLSRLVHVARSALGGHVLRIRSKVRPVARRAGVAAPAMAMLRPQAIQGVTVALRAGERLDPRALEIVARAFAQSAEIEALYGDIAEGGVISPRPDWDAELAAFAAFAPSPVFFRGEREVADAWALLRELAQRPGAVARIPLPLARSEEVAGASYTLPAVPKLTRMPRVSVVIPTKFRIDLLERCLASLSDTTGYADIEVVVVNNGAEDPRFPGVLATASARMKLEQVDDFGPFNFSRLTNAGVRRSTGEIVLLLNDDVEAIEPGWLHRMVESALDPGVGCVGARLLYDDRTIQHAGVTLGISGICGHLWKGLDQDAAAAIPQVVLPSQRMAVTGACLALRREVFDRAGGLDEEGFPVAYNDIDLCLRVGALGYRTVYRGDAVLIHHESQSRGSDSETMAKKRRLARETRLFLARWDTVLRNDPFGSPAFDPTTESGAVHPALARD